MTVSSQIVDKMHPIIVNLFSKELLESVPVLKYTSSGGFTGYIDYIETRDVVAPISIGIDTCERPYICLRYGDTVQTLFQRYSDDKTIWSDGQCGYMLPVRANGYFFNRGYIAPDVALQIKSFVEPVKQFTKVLSQVRFYKVLRQMEEVGCYPPMIDIPVLSGGGYLFREARDSYAELHARPPSGEH